MRTICVAGVCTLFAGMALAPAAQEPVALPATEDFRRGMDEGLVRITAEGVTRDRISSGTIGEWTPTTPFPSIRQSHRSVAYNGFLYAVGGSEPQWNRVVSVAPIQADGTLGSWTHSVTLPVQRWSHGLTAYNGFLYAIGGMADTRTSSNVSLVARINEDGTLGPWTATTSLPGIRHWLNCVAYNGYIYAVGGTSTHGGRTAGVLYSAVKADGTLGPWIQATSLPEPRDAHATVVHNGFMVVLGGFTEEFNRQADDVMVAPINADGSLGDWTKDSPMPQRRGFAPCAAAHGGFVYLWQGFDGSSAAPLEVLVAPFNPDGTLGAWSTTTSIPEVRLSGSAAVFNGILYSVGGSSGPAGGDVNFARVIPDEANAHQAPARLRGVYSTLLDLNEESLPISVKIDGRLSPGGKIRMQTALAPESTLEFRAHTDHESVPLGHFVSAPGGGRYLSIRLTLDDTETTDPSQPTTITGITINRPPTANAGPDRTVASTGHDGADVILDGRASTDPDGNILSYEWFGPFGSVTGATPTVRLPLGTSEIMLAVHDSAGVQNNDFMNVTVVDATAPTIESVTASPRTLSPSDQTMRHVTVSVSAFDAGDPAPVSQILSVSSNQPQGKLPDWEITGDLTVNLRAEQKGKDRVYTIVVRCTDHSGNSSTATATVTVPREAHGKKAR